MSLKRKQKDQARKPGRTGTKRLMPRKAYLKEAKDQARKLGMH